MKNKIKYLIVLTLLLVLFTGLTVKADTGPKPSVNITINNIDSDIYVSLLSKTESTGPYRDIKEGEYEYNNLDEIGLKFYEYAKTDDYYFFGYIKKLTKDDNIFKWTYYPPYDFKVICYIENADEFVVTESSLSSYAFDTYYKMDLENVNGTYVLNNIKKNYNYLGEILHFLLRVAITLLIELLLAFFIFKFRAKAFLIIIITNIVTQVTLNVLLNFTNYNSGRLMLLINYILLELLVLIIEMITYLLLIRKYDKSYSKARIILYAILANISSFILGYIILTYVPGLS